MKLIENNYNAYLNACQHTWLADDPSEITAGFDPDGCAGSMIVVISTKDTYMKNTKGKWQKYGTTEVI